MCVCLLFCFINNRNFTSTLVLTTVDIYLTFFYWEFCTVRSSGSKILYLRCLAVVSKIRWACGAIMQMFHSSWKNIVFKYCVWITSIISSYFDFWSCEMLWNVVKPLWIVPVWCKSWHSQLFIPQRFTLIHCPYE